MSSTANNSGRYGLVEAYWAYNHEVAGSKPPSYFQHIRHISNCMFLTQIIIIYEKLL